MSPKRCLLLFAMIALCACAAHAQQLRLSGGVYLWEHIPLRHTGPDKFELYAAMLNADTATDDGKYGLHVQARGRDSKFRPYFDSNVWFQEAYAFAKTPAGELRAGKIYRKVGIFWDDSFTGNLQYFNGLKLNPDYGAEIVGPWYSLQWINNNDHVAGSLDGADVESDPNGRLRLATARIAPILSIGKAKITLGASGANGRIARPFQAAIPIRQVAGDVTLEVGPLIAYVEGLDQKGSGDYFERPAYLSSSYELAGIRWQITQRMNARINASRVFYRPDQGHYSEWRVVPGVVVGLAKNIDVIAEGAYWQGPSYVYERSANFVLHYRFGSDTTDRRVQP